MLPGTTESFEQFQVDDGQCRQWALQQTGTAPNQAGAASTATGAAVGTAVGAGNAYGAGASAQNKYDIGYVQCMYAQGDQVPVPRGSQPAYTSAVAPPPPPPDVPPPPAGTLPPPPPGAVR
jgi:ABC-type phosphate transport system substrate-binding protein